MSKLLFLAVVGLAISSVAQLPPPSPSPTESSKKDQYGSRDNQSNTKVPNSTAQAIPTSTNQAATQPAKKNVNAKGTPKRDKSPINWWVVFNAALLTVFNGALAWIGWKQYHGMRQQIEIAKNNAEAAQKSANAATGAVELARQNMHLDQRAWVAPNEVITKNGSNQPLTATILLKNTGKTFAKRCFVSSNRTVKALTDADPDFDTLMQEAKKINLGIIAPSQQVPYTISANFKSNDPDAVRLIFGKVTYTDVFNYDHWTTFCYRILESNLGGSRVERYTSYNNAH